MVLVLFQLFDEWSCSVTPRRFRRLFEKTVKVAPPISDASAGVTVHSANHMAGFLNGKSSRPQNVRMYGAAIKVYYGNIACVYF